jgi:hypothetical protein
MLSSLWYRTAYPVGLDRVPEPLLARSSLPGTLLSNVHWIGCPVACPLRQTGHRHIIPKSSKNWFSVKKDHRTMVSSALPYFFR